MPLRYKADERSIHVAVVMDPNETSTFSATVSDEQLFRWDRIFENVLSENSPYSTTFETLNTTYSTLSFENLSEASSYFEYPEFMEVTSPTPSPKISNPLAIWYLCIIIIIVATLLALILTFVLVYKRAHSELTRLLAVQSDVEKGMFIFQQLSIMIFTFIFFFFIF